jgi:Cutinase
LAGLALTALALAGGVARGQQTRDGVGARGGEACPSVLVLGSRGSGEAAGLGKPVAAFVAALRDRMAGVVAAANAYPAVPVSFAQLAKELAREPFRLSSAYTKSVATGRDTLRTMIATEVRLCPSTKLVLAGYSQGAQVTGDVVAALARSDAADSKKAWARISGVVLFADPDYNHLDHSDVVTAFQRKTQAGLRNDGILVQPPVTRPRAFPRSTYGRVLSYCIAQDPVCQGLGQLALHGMRAHDAYGRPGAPQPIDAARYVASHVTVAQPQMLTQRSVKHPFEVRPPVVTYTGDGSGVLGGFDGSGIDRTRHKFNFGHLKWSAWTAEKAVGSGAVWLDDCNPDCADGTFTPTAVSVLGTAPRHGYFSRLTLKFSRDGKNVTDIRGVRHVPASSLGPGYYEYYIVSITTTP